MLIIKQPLKIEGSLKSVKPNVYEWMAGEVGELIYPVHDSMKELVPEYAKYPILIL